MADSDLAAAQVVEEEQESPVKKRSLFAARKGLIIGAAVFVVWSVVLFFIFDMLAGNAPDAEAGADPAEDSKPPLEFSEYLAEARQVEIGEIDIWDESDPSPRALRRFSAEFTVWIEADAMEEIEQAMEVNPDALNRVQAAIRQKIHEWMLRTGGEALRGLDMQDRGKSKVKDYLNDKLGPLRKKILDVSIYRFRAARY